MPLTTTINLSDIPGVTIYASKAAAKSGAVDSRAAINAYLNSTYSSFLFPLEIQESSGKYIYSTAGLQMCGTGYSHVTWKRVGGTAATGIVWAKETSAKWKFGNPDKVSTFSAVVNTDLAFYDLQFDFNYEAGDAQVHDDTTWGWAVGVSVSGVKRIRFERCELLYPRTFIGQMKCLYDIQVIDCIQDVGEHGEDFNYDAFHYNSPIRLLEIRGGNIKSNDDAIPLNATEPDGGGNDQNYRAAPWYQDWVPSTIEDVIIKNVTLNNAKAGIRLLSLSPGTAVKRVLIDGVAGSVRQYFVTADPYEEDNTGGVPNQGTCYTEDITLRDNNIQQGGGSYQPYKPGRINIHSNALRWDINLATHAPVTADGNTVPYLYVHQRTPVSATDTWTWGKAIGTDFADDFNRADSAAGGVGGTYSDPSNAYRIASNKLTVPRDITGHNLTPPGFSSVVDSYFSLDMTRSAGALDTVAVITRDGGNGTNNFYAPLVYQSASSVVETNKYTGGSPEILNSKSVTLTNGTSYRLESRQIGPWLLNDTRNLSTDARLAPMTAFANTSYTAAGKTTLSTYAGAAGGDMVFDRLRVQEYIARPILLSMALSHGAKDAEGYVAFTATQTPSGSVYDGGTWTTTAGVINAFGMLRDVPEGVTATVTYAAFGVTSSSGTYTEPGSGSGTPLAAPSLSGPASVTKSRLNGMSFTAATGGTGPYSYQGQRKKTADATWVDVSDSFASPFDVKSLLASTEYQVRVRVTDSVGDILYSNTIMATTAAAPAPGGGGGGGDDMASFSGTPLYYEPVTYDADLGGPGCMYGLRVAAAGTVVARQRDGQDMPFVLTAPGNIQGDFTSVRADGTDVDEEDITVARR